MQEGAFAAYARNERRNVIMFDTTWGTNRFGMKLGFFTTVGANGETLILAGVIMMYETKGSFEWAFERFIKCFKIPPKVIVTDGDVGIIGACASTLPDTVRLTCVWHLSLNFTTHIRPILCFDMASWRAVLNAWWRLAKQTDVSAQATFEADFQKIVDVVEALKPAAANTRATAKHKAALKWLDWLRSVKKTWAACYTWSTCTLGVHSTQVCWPWPTPPAAAAPSSLHVQRFAPNSHRIPSPVTPSVPVGAASRAALRVDSRRHQAARDAQHAPHRPHEGARHVQELRFRSGRDAQGEK